MLKSVLILAIQLVYLVSSFAQPPDWIDPVKRKRQYPSSTYVLGFSSTKVISEGQLDQMRESSRQHSRMDLAELLSNTVNISSNTREQSGSGDFKTFDKKSIAAISLEDLGLVTMDHFDQAKSTVYAFSFIEKKKLVTAYYKQLSQLMNEVKRQIQKTDYVTIELEYDALNKLLYSLELASEYSSMLSVLGMKDDIILRKKEQLSYKHITNERINAIKKSASQNIDVTLKLLADQIARDFNTKLGDLYVSGITFENTNATTEFSLLIDSRIKDHLVATTKITNRVSDFRLSGKYFLIEDQVQLTLNIHQYDGDEPFRLIAGEAATLLKEEVDKLGVNYVYQPIDDFQLEDIVNNEVNGGLFTQITTQKGNEGLFFETGERMNLYVKVSQPAYIRLVNVWSDGAILSLYENYYMDETKVNQLFEIPLSWEAACPCGTEAIKLFAQSRPFTDLSIRLDQGYEYIENPLEELGELSRYEYKKEGQRPEFYFGESSILLTTIQK